MLLGNRKHIYNVVVPAVLKTLFGGFGLGGGLSGVQGLEQAEEAGGFSDAAELDAEGLDLDEEVLHVDDLVSDQRLQEDADQPDQAVLEDRTDASNREPTLGTVPRGALRCVPACTCP